MDKGRNKYLFLAFFSALLLSLYGQRFFMLFALSYSFLVCIKYKKAFRIYKVLFAVIGILLLSFFVVYIRGGQIADLENISFTQKVVINTFGEWREYSYVVDKFHRLGGVFLKEKILIGIIAPLLPKQIWLLMGFDKNELLSYNAANYFGRYFGHYAGIRIGVIGECFVSFGRRGVILIMSLLGLIFGWLEKRFLFLDKEDPVLSVACFILSMIIFLPLMTFINITELSVYFGFFIFINYMVCTRRTGLNPGGQT